CPGSGATRRPVARPGFAAASRAARLRSNLGTGRNRGALQEMSPGRRRTHQPFPAGAAQSAHGRARPGNADTARAAAPACGCLPSGLPTKDVRHQQSLAQPQHATPILIVATEAGLLSRSNDFFRILRLLVVGRTRPHAMNLYMNPVGRLSMT